MTDDEATQIADLLNRRNQLMQKYDRHRVLESADEYVYRSVDGLVVVFAQLKRLLWYEAEVLHLSVHEDHENQGHARRLLAEVLTEARLHGYCIVQCTIREGNTDSEKLFESAGFKKVSRFRNPDSGRNISVLHYVLAPAGGPSNSP
jgi:ribosomal protein S18 acetylase RimI-like enzyme